MYTSNLKLQSTSFTQTFILSHKTWILISVMVLVMFFILHE